MDSTDNARPQPQPNRFHEAIFLGSATDPSDTLMVIIPEFSADEPFGDPDGVVWSPVGGALPQDGDRALVAESDDGSWWVLSWWSDDQGTGVSQASVDALEARPAYARGTGTASWSAAVLSGAVTVAHGLGVTPTTVELQSRHVLFGYAVTARDATNITVQGFTTYNGATTAGPLTFDWLAIA